MARGWESKAIEDQISAAEARQERRANASQTPQEIERQRRKQGLLLERTRLVRQMQGAQHERYVALLASALHHIDQELAALEEPAPNS
jgi:hypothetical protein